MPIEPNGRIQSLDVRFSYDINGLLEVDVNMLETNKTHTKVIDHSPIGLSEEQKRQSHERLLALKIHPRDEMPNRALRARLERALAQTLGNERIQIGIWLTEFDELLGEHRVEEIAAARKQLMEYLDSMKL